MKQYILKLEQINGDKSDNKVYIINQYQKEKIEKIVEENKEENSSIND